MTAGGLEGPDSYSSKLSIIQEGNQVCLSLQVKCWTEVPFLFLGPSFRLSKSDNSTFTPRGSRRTSAAGAARTEPWLLRHAHFLPHPAPFQVSLPVNRMRCQSPPPCPRPPPSSFAEPLPPRLPSQEAPGDWPGRCGAR